VYQIIFLFLVLILHTPFLDYDAYVDLLLLLLDLNFLAALTTQVHDFYVRSSNCSCKNPGITFSTWKRYNVKNHVCNVAWHTRNGISYMILLDTLFCLHSSTTEQLFTA